MKSGIALCFIIFFTLSHNLGTAKEIPLETIKEMIEDDLFLNHTKIKESTLKLNYADKLLLREEYRMSGGAAGCAATLNYLIGFGVGSYFQGDIFGGNMGLIGDLTGISIIPVGMIIASSDNSWSRGTITFLYSTFISVGVILLSRIIGIGRTVYYWQKYNNHLNDALNLAHSDYKQRQFDITQFRLTLFVLNSN